MRRRRFIECGAAGCLVVTLAPGSAGAGPAVTTRLRAMLGAPDQAAAIGRACLAADLVSPAAVDDFVATLEQGAVDDHTIVERLARRRTADFVAGRLVSLRGWQLAESEALAFAAVALS